MGGCATKPKVLKAEQPEGPPPIDEPPTFPEPKPDEGVTCGGGDKGSSEGVEEAKDENGAVFVGRPLGDLFKESDEPKDSEAAATTVETEMVQANGHEEAPPPTKTEEFSKESDITVVEEEKQEHPFKTDDQPREIEPTVVEPEKPIHEEQVLVKTEDCPKEEEITVLEVEKSTHEEQSVKTESSNMEPEVCAVEPKHPSSLVAEEHEPPKAEAPRSEEPKAESLPSEDTKVLPLEQSPAETVVTASDATVVEEKGQGDEAIDVVKEVEVVAVAGNEAPPTAAESGATAVDSKVEPEPQR